MGNRTRCRSQRGGMRWVGTVAAACMLAAVLAGGTRAVRADTKVHLFVRLMDRIDDKAPLGGVTFTEKHGKHVALGQYQAADKARALWIRTGPAYQVGDHIQLHDEHTDGPTDTICIDPDVLVDDPIEDPSGKKWTRVDLEKVDFCDKAASLRFVLNPRAPEPGRRKFRVRLSMAKARGVGSGLPPLPIGHDLCPYPDIVIYDWQQSKASPRINLHRWHFANKGAVLIAEAGDGVGEGDDLNHIILYDSLDPGDCQTILDLSRLASKPAADSQARTTLTWCLYGSDHLPDAVRFRLRNPGK